MINSNSDESSTIPPTTTVRQPTPVSSENTSSSNGMRYINSGHAFLIITIIFFIWSRYEASGYNTGWAMPGLGQFLIALITGAIASILLTIGLLFLRFRTPKSQRNIWLGVLLLSITLAVFGQFVGLSWFAALVGMFAIIHLQPSMDRVRIAAWTIAAIALSSFVSANIFFWLVLVVGILAFIYYGFLAKQNTGSDINSSS